MPKPGRAEAMCDRCANVAHGMVSIQYSERRSAKVSDCWNFIICDPAASEKESADYTVVGAFAVTPLRDLLVIDIRRGQWPIDRIVPEIAAACRQHEPAWVGIESIGFQWAITFAAQRHPGIPTVKGLEPGGKGKLVRATPAIIRCEQGQLFFPESAPWLEDFEGELLRFTGDDKIDAHDDQVDVTAWAVQELDRFGVAHYVAPLEQESEQESSWDQRDREAGRYDQRGGLFGKR